MAVLTQVDKMPQVEVFNRVLRLPMIQYALEKSGSTYLRVKDSNQLVHWALSTAENSIYSATKHAVPIATPIVHKFSSGIQFVDNTLCMGLNKIEEKIPIIKDTPAKILEKSYMFTLDALKPAVLTVGYANELIILQTMSLKKLSWDNANRILSTYYGTVAIEQLNSTAVIIDKIIDRYFPAIGDEQPNSKPTSIDDDKLLHTLQTLGKLSRKAARRVFNNIIENIQILNKDKIKIYINLVVVFLQIANYLHAVNYKVVKFSNPPKTLLKANNHQQEVVDEDVKDE